ncbi:hypothetical protein NSA60_18125 [Pseudomonas oleovorans]|uniref:hypothetical protein n=1 Tax=Ectopseudomonas oleovorans TaxID=301 RepID=UPI00214AA1F7|nr:hypothetical protein [Pseudomonas oleovorans]MCR1828570.1 hypothetical protein [Pseudomonas oleovorans]
MYVIQVLPRREYGGVADAGLHGFGLEFLGTGNGDAAGVSGGGILLAHWVTRQRDFPGRESFILLHLASLCWMVTAALEMTFLSATSVNSSWLKHWR